MAKGGIGILRGNLKTPRNYVLLPYQTSTVRQSATNVLIHHQIFQIFCSKLVFNKYRKVTFSNKKCFSPKINQIGQKIGFLSDSSSLNHQIELILHI